MISGMIRLNTYKFISILVLLSGCTSSGSSAKSDFHTILGSADWGYAIAEVGLKVHRDIRAGELRIRQISMEVSACKSNRGNFLELQGRIGPDSTEIVRRVFADLTPCIDRESGLEHSTLVFLDSSGGLMTDGIALGRMFRQEGVQAAITKGQTCASACALAFLGGIDRVMHKDDARLVFHAPYVQTLGGIDCSDRGQVEIIKQYFTEMLGPVNGEYVFDRNQAYCSDSEGWELNLDAAKVFGIVPD